MIPDLLVMLIDDDRDDQEIFASIMQEIDDSIQVVSALDGVEALDLLSGQPAVLPDVIFLDVNMPRMNGFECLGKIRQILPAIPLYMYSTSDEKMVARQCGPERPTGFLKKYPDPNMIKEKLLLILQSPVVSTHLSAHGRDFSSHR